MKKILTVLLSFALIVSLTACGGGSASSDAGYYKVYSMTENGATYDIEKIKSLNLDESIYLQLLEDGTGSITIIDETTKLTWKKGEITEPDTGNKIPYTIDGDKLSCESDGIKLIFQKSTGTPPPAKSETSSAETSGTETSSASSTVDSVPTISKSLPFSSAADNTSEKSTAATSSGDLASGTVGDYGIKIIGAEPAKDTDGNDAIRFYFDFTNNSSSAAAAFSCLDVTAKQDDYELVSTYAAYDENVPANDYTYLSVEPSVTLRCAKEFSYKPTGGKLVLTIGEYISSEKISQDFNVQSLPGNGGDWSINPITDPTYAASLPSSGTVDGNYEIKIDHSEIVPSYDSGNVIRLYYTFTNNTDETITPSYELNLAVFQDGVGLNFGFAGEALDSDSAADVELSPGASVDATSCYGLRTSSPVEFVISDSMYDPVIGYIAK